MLSQINIPDWISYHLPVSCWVLMAFAFLAVMWLLGVWVSRMRIVVNAKRGDDEEVGDPSLEVGLMYPPVSVIITATPGSQPLIPLVESVLSQDYPAAFEVIVVIDGIDHVAHDKLHRLMLSHGNLYATFAPEDSRSLSRRKLSLMLGIKASQYDVLMLTRGNCRVVSPMWLRTMMRHVAQGSEVVVGWTIPMQVDEHEPGRLRRAYDSVWTALTWLPRAIKGRPYKATGCNLAYTKRLFFDHKGFSHTLHIKGGDDDMFVYEIAKNADCSVELSDQSMVEEEVENARSAHRNAKAEYFFTGEWLPKRPSLIMGSFSLSWWVWLLAGAGACVVGLPSLLPAIVVVLLGLVMIVVTAVSWKTLSSSLHIVPVVWSFPFLALWHPFYQLGYRIKSFKNRKNNYTWH